MTIFSVYPIEIITGEWGAIQIFPVPCPPLIEVALYHRILNDSNINSETMDW